MALDDLVLPPPTRADDTPEAGAHASDHNLAAIALAALRDEVLALEARVAAAGAGVIAYPTGSPPSLAGVPDGTLLVEYLP